MSEPFQDKCVNHGWDAGFTCPGCYADLPFDEWHGKTGKCPECDRLVECRTDSEPISICELAEEEEAA